jgi:tetratricopeptide (TPR) repeat protein
MNEPADQQRQSTRQQRLRVVNLGILLCVVALACYSSSFAAPFIFDDVHWIVQQPVHHALESLQPALQYSRRPLWNFSLAANYALGGLDPRGYHLLNVAVHLAAGVVLFELVRRTLLLDRVAVSFQLAIRQAGSLSPRGDANWLALAVALIWVVHPLQTESVTYIVQRCESMMGLFYLLCLYCVLRGSQSPRGWPWYAAAALAFALGIGSKEVMITAPLVVLAYDRIFLAGSWRDVLRRRWGLYLAMLPPLLWLTGRIVPAIGPSVDSSAGFGVQNVTAWQYLCSQPGVILHYLRLAFWPDRLCLDYQWPVARTPWEIIVPGAVIASLLLASLAALRYWPKIGFLGLTFFVILAPTSSIMPIRDLAVEHRMYLPLAPLTALFVLGFYRAAGWALLPVESSRARKPNLQKTISAAALVLVVIALGWRTYQRNADYVDPIRLWQKALEVAPHNFRVHHNLAFDLHIRGRYEEATQHYRIVLQNAPDHARAHYNLATLLAAQGEAAEAIELLREARRLEPGLLPATLRLAALLATADDAALRSGSEAVRLMEEVIQRFPQPDSELLDILSACYAEAGRYDEAVTAAQQAIRLAPPDTTPDDRHEMQLRLDRYKLGKPFRQPNGAYEWPVLKTHRG